MLRRLAFALVLFAWIPAARADTLVLANGDELNGEVVSWAVDHVVIDHPQLGLIRLALDQLRLDTGKPPNPGLFGTDFLRGWNRSVEFGISGKQGNSANSNLTAGFAFDYEDEFTRWTFDGRYFFDRDETGVTDNNARVDLRRDWLVPGSPWFGFTMLRYQYDEFESWLHRGVVTAGPGYELLRREGHSLDARLGATFTQQAGSRPRSRAESLFAFDYSWSPAERYTFSLSNELFLRVYPRPGAVRNFSLADLKIALLEQPALSLRMGTENEFETEPDPGDKPNDLKYYLNLGVGF